jgi:PAS domain S-box-containing protein
MKILAIDDREDNLIAITAMLKSYVADCDIKTATTGMAGLQLALTFQPDTILLDIQMPGMDGFQVCQMLKNYSVTRHIPIIFLTAQQPDAATQVRGLGLGADGFINKPIEAIALAAHVRAMVRIKVAEDALRADKQELERAVAERTAALQAETTKLDTIFDASPVAMLVLDDQTNVVRRNAAAAVLAVGDLVVATPPVVGQGSGRAASDGEQRQPSGTGFQPVRPEQAGSLSHHAPLEPAQHGSAGASLYHQLNGNDLVPTHPPRHGDVLGCVHCTEDPRGCGYAPDCRLCPLRQGVESVLAGGAAVRGAELTLDLLRDGSPQKVWLRVGAEPILIAGQRHVVVALDDITEGKRAEARLRESESRFRTIFDESPIAIWEEDFSGAKSRFDELRQAGVTDFRAYFDQHPEEVAALAARVRIVAVNQRSIELLGAESAANLPKNLAPYFTEASLREFAQELIALAEGQRTFRAEVPIVNSRGEPRQLDLTLSVPPEYAHNLSRVLVSFIDITERRQAEEELRGHQVKLKMQNEDLRQAQTELDAARTRYFDLYDLAPVSYVTVSESGFILETNLTAATLLGVERSALVQRPLSKFIFREDQDIYYLHRQKLMATGTLQAYELRMVKADGTAFWAQLTATAALDAAGQPVGRVVLSNITARKVAEAAVQRQQVMLARTEKITHLGSWEWEIAADRVTWSDEMFRIFQLDPRAGAPSFGAHSTLYHSDDMRRLQHAVAAAVADGTPYELELRAIRQDGATRLCVARGLAEMAPDGRVTRLFGSLQDITARKQAEEKLNKSLAILNETGTIAKVGGWELDVTTGIPTWTEETFRIFEIDLTQAEPPLPEGLSSYAPASQPIIAQAVQRAIEHGEAYDLELELITKRGHHRWVHTTGRAHQENGQTKRLSGAIQDVTERKLAELAQQETHELLRLSEENLAVTLHSIGDAVIATDTAGRITRMNATAERLTGWPLAEAAGRPLPDVFRVVNARTRAPALNPVQLVLERGEVIGLANHTALLARDGQEYQIADSAAPIRNPAGQIVGVVLVFSDVTESYRVQQALATTAELLERTGAMAKVGGWELDLRTRLHYWSRETCRLIEVDYPYVSAEVEEGINFYAPEARPLIRAAVQAAMDHGTPYDLEVPFITAKGRHLWVRTQGSAVLEDGQAIKLVGTFQDITDRKQAEQEREEALAMLKAAIAQSPSGMLIADAPDVTIRWANPAALGIRGRSDQPLTGIEVAKHAARWQTFRPDGTPYPAESLPLSRAVLKGETTRDEEVIIRNAQGENRWVSANAAPVRNHDGVITAGLVVFHDITERKRLEAALLRREVLLAAAAQVGRLLLSERDVSAALAEAIRVIGQASQQDRVYLFERHTDAATGETLVSHRFEWVAEGIKPELANPALQNIPFAQVTPYLSTRISRGLVACEHVRDLPSSDRAILEAQGIMSILLVPVEVVGHFWGFIGFDKCRGEYDWSVGERVALVTVAAAIGSALERQQAEAALLASEARHAKMVANIGDVIVVIDQAGINRYKSPNLEQWFGWRPEELVGVSTWDNVHPEDLAAAQKFMGTLLATPNATGTAECRYRCKDGTYKWIEFTGVNLLHDPDIRGMLGNYHDITERKRAEADLRLFQELVARSSDAIGMSTPEERHYYQNAAFDRLFGNIGECPPETVFVDRRVGEQVFNTIKAGGEWQGEVQMFRPDRTLADIFLRAYALRDPAGRITALVGLNTDITERKRTEAALRASEVKYRSLIECSSDAIFCVDAEGRYLFTNHLFASTLGHTPEYFVGKTFWDVYPKEHADNRFAVTQRVCQTGKSESLEVEVPLADKSLYFYATANPIRDDTGKVVLVLTNATDITKLKETTAAVQASEARFRSYFELPIHGIAITSVDKGWLQVNDRLCSLLGYSREELARLTWAEMTHPDDLAGDAKQFDRVLAGEIDTYALDKRFIRKDGQAIWTRLGVGGVRKPDGGVAYIVAVLEDISERKRVEATQVFLARTSSGTVAEPFFSTLARYLAQELGMDFVCIDRLEGNGLEARTVAVWCDGKFEDNVTYALKDTPCGEVVGQQVCCFPASVCQFFPRDQVLQDLRAESYLGVTLWSHTGQPIGLIALISRRPLANRAEAEATLKLVSERAAGEMERLAVETALRESHELVSLFMRHSPIYTYIKTVTPTESRVLQASDNFQQMIGRSGAEVVGKTMAELFPADLAAKITADDWAVVSKGEMLKVEEELNGRSYTTIKFPIVQGAKTLLAGYTMDITERKQAEAALHATLRDKEALLQEVHHRVNNNLQVITSLLRLEAGRSEHLVTKAVLKDMQGRIRAMALLHEYLYRSGQFAQVDLGAYVKQVTNKLFRAFSPPPDTIRCQFELAPVFLTLDQAVPCGLITNELVSNCLKHGFPEGRRGELRIAVQLVDGGPEVRLRVADTGVGLPEDFAARQKRSLGLQLVSDLVRQLQGRLAIGPGPEAVFEVTFTPKPGVAVPGANL